MQPACKGHLLSVLSLGLPTIQAPRSRKSPGAERALRGFMKNLGNYLLSHMKICSIIGEKELNFRVRNGIGCTLLSMVTKKYANI